MVYKKIDRALKRAGWVILRVKGSHCQYGHAGISYVVTVPNHGSKDLSPIVINNIEKGTGLSFR